MENRKRALCVINPAAGKGRTPQGLQDTVRKYISHEYEVSFFITSGKGDAARAASSAAADGASLMICCGGDGTLNEIVSGIHGAQVNCPVLYVPCGTTNDIARTLSLPRGPKSCLALLREGRPVPIDAGLFNGDSIFTYIAAFGAFTQLSYDTPQRLKNMLGYPAYLLGFFKGLLHVRSHRLTVYADGERMQGRYLFGSVTNALSIGGAVKLDGQGVHLSDGQLELLLVERPKPILLLPYVMLKLGLKKYNTRGILLRKCEKLSFRFDDPADWTLDGEYGGRGDWAEIEALPRCYRVYVSAP